MRCRLTFLLLVLLTACGGREEPGIRVIISPADVKLKTGCTIIFSATVVGDTDNRLVTFAILEPNGGTFEYTRATSNSIFYHAPAIPGTFHVVATANAAPSQQATAIAHVVPSDGGGC